MVSCALPGPTCPRRPQHSVVFDAHETKGWSMTKVRTSHLLLRGTALAAVTIGGQALPAAGSTAPPPTLPPPSAPIGSLPVLSNPADPVVWRGVFRDSAGAPMRGGLAVSARSNSGGRSVLPLGTVTTDEQGQFEVRLPWRADLAAIADSAGNVTFMLVASSSVNFTMTTHTMTYVPEVGRWAGAAQAAARRGDTAPQANAHDVVTRFAALDGLTEDIKAIPTTVAAGGPVANTPQPGGTPIGFPVECRLKSLGDLPPSKSYVGQTKIAKAGGWDVQFMYKNTKTTANEVGVAVNWGAFSASGSTTVESALTAATEITTASSTATGIGRKHWITSSFYQYGWKCWMGQGPAPQNDAYWSTVQTIEKGPWYSNFSVDDFGEWGVPQCTSWDGGPNDWEVPPNSSVQRISGASFKQANSFSISVPDNPAKFSGGLSVANSTEVGAEVINKYTNKTATAKKHLCGVNGENPIFGDTPVLATNRIT